MHRVPEVGKFWQCAVRLFAARSSLVLMPRESETLWHVSPVAMVWTMPSQDGVGLGLVLALVTQLVVDGVVGEKPTALLHDEVRELKIGAIRVSDIRGSSSRSFMLERMQPLQKAEGAAVAVSHHVAAPRTGFLF